MFVIQYLSDRNGYPYVSAIQGPYATKVEAVENVDLSRDEESEVWELIAP